LQRSRVRGLDIDVDPKGFEEQGVARKSDRLGHTTLGRRAVFLERSAEPNVVVVGGRLHPLGSLDEVIDVLVRPADYEILAPIFVGVRVLLVGVQIDEPGVLRTGPWNYLFKEFPISVEAV